MKNKTVIQIDTREKSTDHIKDVFISKNVKFVSSKLLAGDYMNWDNPRIVVERKNSILELANTVGAQHERFKAELKMSTDYGLKIIILVEEDGFFCLEDLKEWVNPFQTKNPRAMSGKTLYKILSRYLEYYDVEIEFCSKLDAGQRIIELLRAT